MWTQLLDGSSQSDVTVQDVESLSRGEGEGEGEGDGNTEVDEEEE